MPSLMPGTAGAKEVYGISVLGGDLKVTIPPAAMERYGICPGDVVLLTTTHKGEGGFGLMNSKRAEETVFAQQIGLIEGIDSVTWIGDRAFAATRMGDGEIELNAGMLEAFHLRTGERLLVVKGAAIGMAFVPVHMWEDNLRRMGFTAAAENIKKLPVF